MEIKPKYELKSKGETAALPTVEQLLVKLGWSSTVDLDLMAFYETKDGAVGGVYSNEISNDETTLGNLNDFPFVQLSGDSGVGKSSDGEEVEELRITKLDNIKTLSLVALNYTGAKDKDATASFSAYNGHIQIIDEQGNNFDVPLADAAPGTVAHIATINNSPVGATLKREDTVMSFSDFITKIPGAQALVN